MQRHKNLIDCAAAQVNGRHSKEESSTKRKSWGEMPNFLPTFPDRQEARPLLL